MLEGFPRGTSTHVCVLWRGAINDQPDQSALRETLRSTLQECVRTQNSSPDPGLSHASSEALRLLDSNDAQSADLSAAVAAVAVVVGGSAEVPPTSAETSRLVESQPEERDSALLTSSLKRRPRSACAVRTNYAGIAGPSWSS